MNENKLKKFFRPLLERIENLKEKDRLFYISVGVLLVVLMVGIIIKVSSTDYKGTFNRMISHMEMTSFLDDKDKKLNKKESELAKKEEQADDKLKSLEKEKEELRKEKERAQKDKIKALEEKRNSKTNSNYGTSFQANKTSSNTGANYYTSNDDYIVNGARRALNDYHNAITNGDISSAYDMLSSSRQESMGGIYGMRDGYRTTVSSSLTYARPKYVSDDSVTFDYKLESEDIINGRRLYRTFVGDVTMINIGGIWYLDDMSGREI